MFAKWLYSVRIRDDMACQAVFSRCTRGTPTRMQDSEELPDDVPVADAVEQQRSPSEPVVDEEAPAEPPDSAPLEATPADWQEQIETVDLDPEDDVDR